LFCFGREVYRSSIAIEYTQNFYAGTFMGSLPYATFMIFDGKTMRETAFGILGNPLNKVIATDVEYVLSDDLWAIDGKLYYIECKTFNRTEVTPEQISKNLFKLHCRSSMRPCLLYWSEGKYSVVRYYCKDEVLAKYADMDNQDRIEFTLGHITTATFI
jgi:hypothetical protein